MQLRPHEDDTLLAVNIALSDEHEGGGTWVQALGGGGAGGPHEDAVSAGPLHTDETAAPVPFLPTLGPAARGARPASLPPERSEEALYPRVPQGPNAGLPSFS